MTLGIQFGHLVSCNNRKYFCGSHMQVRKPCKPWLNELNNISFNRNCIQMILTSEQMLYHSMNQICRTFTFITWQQKQAFNMNMYIPNINLEGLRSGLWYANVTQ